MRWENAREIYDDDFGPLKKTKDPPGVTNLKSTQLNSPKNENNNDQPKQIGTYFGVYPFRTSHIRRIVVRYSHVRGMMSGYEQWRDVGICIYFVAGIRGRG